MSDDIDLRPGWRSRLAGWPDVMRERHRAASEALQDVGWGRDGANYLAFERLEDEAKEYRASERLKQEAAKERQSCSVCGEGIDDGEETCEDCLERQYEEWREHQIWMRLSDKERRERIRWELH